MSSNRLKYDKCAYVANMKESTEPLEYNLFVGKYENCEKCPIGKYGNILPFGAKTNTESELLGLTRPNSKCPEKKYQAESTFKNMPLSAAKMCDSIYYITPNNLEKPTSNMINEKKLAANTKKCSRIEKFVDDEDEDDESYRDNIKCNYNSLMTHYNCTVICNNDNSTKDPKNPSDVTKNKCLGACDFAKTNSTTMCNNIYPTSESQQKCLKDPYSLSSFEGKFNNIKTKIEGVDYDKIKSNPSVYERTKFKDFMKEIKEIYNC